MKLWLDDIRPAPPGWTWVKTAVKAAELIKSGVVDIASLDHDLGSLEGGMYGGSEAPTGYDLVKWMVRENCFPRVVRVHSANPVGRMNMVETLKRYKPECLK